MNVVINRWLRADDVFVRDGVVEAGSMSAVLAAIERERRRDDAIAAFAPELLIQARFAERRARADVERWVRGVTELLDRLSWPA
jgi:hypothetical protein